MQSVDTILSVSRRIIQGLRSTALNWAPAEAKLSERPLARLRCGDGRSVAAGDEVAIARAQKKFEAFGRPARWRAQTAEAFARVRQGDIGDAP